MSTSSSHPDPILRFEGLAHRYTSDGPTIVQIDNLAISKGEQVVLTGVSGTGKSTLLHLIAGLMDPTQGTIIVNGVDMRALRGAKRDRFRGRTIGMVFQTFHLLHGFSAMENVLAALMFSDLSPKGHRARASDLLTTLGIDRPHAKIDTLSVGQQQRVAVARAVACTPAIVLADEPTAALDHAHADGAIRVLQDACNACGAALVCVTHDRSIVDRFDRHIPLESLRSREEVSA